MSSTIRAARPEDIPHLAALQVLGSHGIIEAIYHDLMPGKTVAEMIERRFLFEGSSKSYKNCWVVEVDGEVAGDLHAHLYDDMDGDPPDPIVPEERYGVVEPMIAIEKPAYGPSTSTSWRSIRTSSVAASARRSWICRRLRPGSAAWRRSAWSPSRTTRRPSSICGKDFARWLGRPRRATR